MAQVDCVPVPVSMLQNPAWRAVSAAARGFWLDLAGLAWQGKYRGFLCDPQGRAWNLEALARLTGHSAREVQRWIGELEREGLLGHTTDGVFFIPTLVERAELSRKRQEAALKRWHGTKATPTFGYANDAKCYAKSMQTGMQTGMQNGCKPVCKPMANRLGVLEADLGEGLSGPLDDAPVERRKLNGHSQLGQSGDSEGQGLEGRNGQNSPPNTPPQEISHGGGGVGVGLGVTGVLRGVLGGRKGAKGEGERGGGFSGPLSVASEAMPTEEAIRQWPAESPPVAPSVQTLEVQPPPVPAEKATLSVGPPGCRKANPVPACPSLETSIPNPPEWAERRLPLKLPPKPPNWQAVEADWYRLGRYWPDGQPRKPRDRKLLWRILGLAHWPENPDQGWARAVLEAFCDAVGQVKNPGAYLERLVRAIGQSQASQEIRLVLRQIETPDWVRRPPERPERSRSPPENAPCPGYPILDYLEAQERERLRAEWRSIHAELLAVLQRPNVVECSGGAMPENPPDKPNPQ